MSQTMVITVVKSDDGSVSASIDSPATTIGAAAADEIAQAVANVIRTSLQ
jgi:ABC-type phosphate transport system permease subunit